MGKEVKKMVPELRFDGFSGNWKLGELTELIHSLDAGVSVNSGDSEASESKKGVLKTSCVAKDIFDPRENKVVFDATEVARLRQPVKAGTIIISRMNTPFLVGANAFVSESFPKLFLPDRLWAASIREEHYPRWVGLLTSTKKVRGIFSNRATGTSGSMKSISKKDVLTAFVHYPGKQEQKKIANFLTAIDAKLDHLRRKRDTLETYKRGIMQKIFSQEIRFTRDDGSAFPDWEIKALKKIANRITTKNGNNTESRVLTNSANEGIVDQREYFDKEIANAKNLANYYVIKVGDYVYNPRISANAPVGPIKRNNLSSGLISPLYSVFRFRLEQDLFYEYFFQTKYWHQHMFGIANYGARHDRMNITINDFMSMPLPCPSLEEQRKIVDLLEKLDTKTNGVADVLERIESFKKGLLQKLFV